METKKTNIALITDQCDLLTMYQINQTLPVITLFLKTNVSGYKMYGKYTICLMT